MPHLYLPAEHNDADLMLAADVATAVSSADLYVTWTHDAGFGAPEIEAVVRDEGAPRPVNPFAELFVALMQGVVSLWQHIVSPPAPRTAGAPMTGPTGQPAAGEPSL